MPKISIRVVCVNGKHPWCTCQGPVSLTRKLFRLLHAKGAIVFSVVNLAPVILFTVSQGGFRKSAGTDNILFTPVSERCPSTVVQYYPWRYCMCAARARAQSTSFPGSEWDVKRRDTGNEVRVLCPDFCSSTDKKLCSDKWPCPRTGHEHLV